MDVFLAAKMMLFVYFSSLLAMGLDQFGHLPSKYRFIRQFLLPTKTEHQLLFRTKYLKANRYNKEKPAVKVATELNVINGIN